MKCKRRLWSEKFFFPTIYPPWNYHSTWKWMVGRLVSCWEGLIFRGYVGFREGKWIRNPNTCHSKIRRDHGSCCSEAQLEPCTFGIAYQWSWTHSAGGSGRYPHGGITMYNHRVLVVVFVLEWTKSVLFERWHIETVVNIQKILSRWFLFKLIQNALTKNWKGCFWSHDC